MSLKVKKLSVDAIIPTKNNNGDAGFDLYSTETYFLKPYERKLFKTNIALEIPEGCFGQICDRSGNALKKGLHVIAGIVDETYRGDVGVVLVNLDKGEVEVKKGDRTAQLIIQKHYCLDCVEVETLGDTVRDDKGWGSSGE